MDKWWNKDVANENYCYNIHTFFTLFSIVIHLFIRMFCIKIVKLNNLLIEWQKKNKRIRFIMYTCLSRNPYLTKTMYVIHMRSVFESLFVIDFIFEYRLPILTLNFPIYDIHFQIVQYVFFLQLLLTLWKCITLNDIWFHRWVLW